MAIHEHDTYENTQTTPSDTQKREIRVWDLPVRLGHWLVVGFVALAWLTGEGEEEGLGAGLHLLAGYGILVIVLFRIIWGFVGSRHARFRSFVRPFAEVRAYFLQILAFRPRPTLGHNPVGGWMVVAILTALLAVVGTGLVASDDAIRGPLAGLAGPAIAHAMAELHEGLTSMLLTLIVIHIAGVAFHSLFGDHAILRAMLTGRKEVPEPEARAEARGACAPWWRAALAFAVATGLVWIIAIQ